MTTPTPSEPLQAEELRDLLAKAKLPWNAPDKFWVYADGKGAADRVQPVVRAGLDDFDAGDKTALIVAAVNTLPHLLDTLATQAATIEAMAKGLRAIVAGDVPRPVAHHWRADKAPSKHDICAHGVEMYADCSNCTAAFIDTLLPEENNNGR